MDLVLGKFDLTRLEEELGLVQETKDTQTSCGHTAAARIWTRGRAGQSTPLDVASDSSWLGSTSGVQAYLHVDGDLAFLRCGP